MGEGGAGVSRVQTGFMEKFEESLERIDFAADRLGSVTGGGQMGDEFFQVDGLD